MAEAILYGVTQTIIERLGSSTLQQIGSIWGVKAEFEKMTNTVSRIQAVLQDAEKQQVNNCQDGDWLMKLRDAVFDADDLLSDFSTHVLRQRVMGADKMPKKVCIFFSSSNQLAFDRKMARKIKAMRGRLDDIAKDRNDFQLESRSLETPVVIRGRGQTHSYVPEEEVIGREKDKEAIIDLLLDFDVEENVSFISIVGLGGLGKTTLAQYVYNDEKIKTYFELKMWVCVSDVFDVKTITEKIIESATRKKPENLEMDQLQIELRKNLDQKKYLLVLDDLWNEDIGSWCNLKRLLIGGSKGSKVMITTRTKLVAEITSTVSPYFLEGLLKDQSWSLLKQMAFKKGQDTIDANLKAIGMDIVEKCQGVPLAIKTIGGVLYFKKTEGEWLHIKNNELTNVTQLRDGILPVLKLSYDYLPSHLKCCFAYCSLFPKDYEINKWTLIQLWIAQGFIQSVEESLQLEDVANEYFMDLHWRSFFQEVREYEGVIMSVKMHDLIHDLAQSVSSIECTLVDSNAKNVNDKVRHLSFPLYNVSFFRENLSLLVKANKIRTFILTRESYWQFDQDVAVEESTLKTLIFTFRYLRALDLHRLKIKTVPNIIGKLMYLKYLDLSWNEIEVLPSSITRLVNLQTLNLSSCRELRELPRDIRKLVSLRQLDTSGCYSLTHMPCGLGKLTSLQTLPLFVVSKEDPTASSKHCGGLAELNKLDLRGRLEITNLEDATSETKDANLKEKKHLTNLELTWISRDDDDLDGREDEISLNGLQPHQSLKYLRLEGYGGVRFSNWLSSLTNLATLYVDDCKKCQHFPPLYQLPYLRVLEIYNMLGLEYMSDQDITDEISASLASSSTTFFPSLESLTLYKCPNLKGWWKRDIVDNSDVGTASTCQQHISLPSFPRLSYLRIQDCCKLTCMPLFPHLEKQLHLENASLKPLQQTMAMTMNTAETSSLPSSSSLPLSKLKRLYLHKMQNVESLPMPEEWVQNLTLLEKLHISCPTLTSLSRFMQHLTYLKELTISNCEEVDLFSDVDDDGSESQRPTSTCLQSLAFTNISKLEALPAFLQHVTTLQRLSILKCPSFTTLPEWLDNLTSLHTLVIIECPNLTSLPEGMRHLSSLQILRIIRCPHLGQRCQKEIGEDWPKIAHVPNYSDVF